MNFKIVPWAIKSILGNIKFQSRNFFGDNTATTTTETQTMGPARFGRNHIYSLTFKLHVINYATSNSIRHTARHFGLDRKIVRRWIASRGAYENQNRLQPR